MDQQHIEVGEKMVILNEGEQLEHVGHLAPGQEPGEGEFTTEHPEQVLRHQGYKNLWRIVGVTLILLSLALTCGAN